MITSKIDRKWFIWIWIALIFASLFRNAYPIYVAIDSLETPSGAEVALNVVYSLFLEGLLPAFLCYLCASVMYSMTARRRIVFSSSTDFIYITMGFTAAARTVMGFIEIFSVLNPVVYTYTSQLLDVTVLSAALLIMYFAVLKPKYLNPVTAFASFSIYMPVYVALQGVNTLLPAVSVFILKSANALPQEYIDLLEQQYGMSIEVSQDMIAAAIAAIVVYVVLLAACILLMEVLRKKAKEYTPPAAPPPPRYQDVNPFDFAENPDMADKDDNVFDEFDI